MAAGVKPLLQRCPSPVLALGCEIGITHKGRPFSLQRFLAPSLNHLFGLFITTSTHYHYQLLYSVLDTLFTHPSSHLWSNLIESCQPVVASLCTFTFKKRVGGVMLRDSSATYIYSSTALQTMSPSLRPKSPPPSRNRARMSPKPNHSIQLANLPRFHPAVYQSTSNTLANQPPSPLQQRPAQSYRIPSGSRDALRQYRDLVAGVTLTPRGSSTTSSSMKPSKPRLDPLGSPGPVTPLALEENEGGYFVAGASRSPPPDSNTSNHNNSPVSPRELVEKLIQREAEKLGSQGLSRKENQSR
ncbi:predicted protein [Histoplasma mississippiense (nom. inval.)]|uniref:predicted protein n=1 Tax=Ajellomyces capsulatus (strain NAm1 / WU24) TaxID=2059318 RepID=UPI000157CF67|nr:predicted protein [Histoplasma mississippiense (nom. inval.)]EDN10763.1 predicted protein [Histoplasma mississippiense (nom. inval.)]